MKKPGQIIIQFLVVFAAASLPILASAHEGHDHAPGVEELGGLNEPIEITEQAKTNLSLMTEEAQIKDIEEVITVYGEIRPIPDRSAVITSRISGRVHSLNVAEGTVVRKGQTLLVVESRQIGDPPPQVEYKSPIDGFVVSLNVVPGDAVEPDRDLLRIVELSEVYAEGRVYQDQLSKVQQGQKVRVIVESFPSQSFDGEIELVSAELDRQSRSLKVWARLSNPAAKLRPNMLATLNIIAGQTDSAIVVPVRAVLGEAGELFVFVQSEENQLKFTRRSVVVGARNDRYLEIIEGVLPGEKVVTTGNYQLQYVTTKAKQEEAEHNQ